MFSLKFLMSPLSFLSDGFAIAAVPRKHCIFTPPPQALRLLWLFPYMESTCKMKGITHAISAISGEQY